MDPNATVKGITQALCDGSHVEAAHLCHDLSDWIRGGGFGPSNWGDNPTAHSFYLAVIYGVETLR